MFSPDSDDSDNEGGLGNVERVVMRPPGILFVDALINIQYPSIHITCINLKMFQGTQARLKRVIYVLMQYTKQVGRLNWKVG